MNLRPWIPRVLGVYFIVFYGVGLWMLAGYALSSPYQWQSFLHTTPLHYFVFGLVLMLTAFVTGFGLLARMEWSRLSALAVAFSGYLLSVVQMLEAAFRGGYVYNPTKLIMDFITAVIVVLYLLKPGTKELFKNENGVRDLMRILIIAAGLYFTFLGGGIIWAIFEMLKIKLPEATASMMRISFVMYLIASAWLLFTAAGIFLRWGWSRISVFVMSGMALFSGIPMILMTLFLPRSMGLKRTFTSGEQIFIIGFPALFFIAIPLALIFLFASKSGRGWFAKANAVAKAARPVGPRIIAVYYAMASVSLVMMAFPYYRDFIPNLVAFDFVVPAAVSRVIFYGMGILDVTLAYGLWTVRSWARPLLIGLNTVHILQTLGILTSSEATLQKMMEGMTKHFNTPGHSPSDVTRDMHSGAWMGLILPVGIILYAIFRKKDFSGHK